MKIKTYVISCIIALGVGLASYLITMGNMNIYEYIYTPPFAPPGFLFPIVWTLLYILMGIGCARVVIKAKEKKISSETAVKFYALQLFVNFTWSIIFFNMKSYFFAFIWLVLLWILIYEMITEFKRIDKTGAFIQIPYLIWVTFAGYLSLGIFLLNG